MARGTGAAGCDARATTRGGAVQAERKPDVSGRNGRIVRHDPDGWAPNMGFVVLDGSGVELYRGPEWRAHIEAGTGISFEAQQQIVPGLSDAWDPYHLNAETADYVTTDELDYDTVVAHLAEMTGGRPGYEYYTGYLLRAMVELAAPGAPDGTPLNQKMVLFCQDYIRYLSGELAMKPQPIYKPVSEADGARLFTLTERIYTAQRERLYGGRPARPVTT